MKKKKAKSKKKAKKRKKVKALADCQALFHCCARRAKAISTGYPWSEEYISSRAVLFLARIMWLCKKKISFDESTQRLVLRV